MSFFARGFGKKKASGGKKEKKEDKKKEDEGEWEMLADAFGRSYWRHTVTGEVSGGLVSPVSTINPSPIGFHGAVFTPSPVQPAFASAPAFVVAPPLKGKKEKKKKGEEKEKEAFWEEKYDKDGVKFWKHTVTRKKTYMDPYY